VPSRLSLWACCWPLLIRLALLVVSGDVEKGGTTQLGIPEGAAGKESTGKGGRSKALLALAVSPAGHCRPAPHQVETEYHGDQ
jgi:hypothetical protein